MSGMARVAVIGEAVRVQGFALAGALVLPAENQAQARAAWRALPFDVAVAVVTPRAAEAIGEALAASAVLTVVMPP